MENEIWKKVEMIITKSGEKFYPDGYEVSNLGRVRSYRSRYGRCPVDGDRPKQVNPTILSDSRMDSSGYIQYNIYDSNRNRKNIRGHVLVMQTFIGIPEENYEVLHYDDVKSNNRLDNLRYGTKSENIKDRKRNSLVKEGGNNRK